MKKELFSFAGDSLVYGLGNILIRATQILILPLIFVYLQKEEFGRLDYFLSIKNILVIVYGWGIMTAIFRFTSAERDDSPFVGLVLVGLIALVSTALIFALMLVSNEFRSSLEDILYTQFISILNAVITIPLSVLRQKRQARKYIFINLLYMIIFMCTAYIFVESTSENYRSIFIGHSIAGVITMCYAFWIIRSYIDFHFNKTKFKEFFNFGFSILLNSISFVLLLATPRFFLKGVATYEEIGILGMSNKLALIIGLFITSPFVLAWLPFVKSIHSKKEFTAIVNNVFRIFLWLGLLCCLCIDLFIYDFFYLIGNREYVEASPYVLPFSIAYFLQGLYFIFSAGIFLTGNNRHYRIIGLVVPVFNIILYLVSWNYTNMFSISVITILSFLVAVALSYIYGNKELKISIFRMENIVICSSYIFMIITERLYMPNEFSIILFVLKILFISILLVLHFISERSIIKKNAW